MYNDYFGFSESPFNITPNPRFYYRTESCDEVLAVVKHGIETRKGLLVIVGEPGSGKTLFLKSLVRDLGPNARTVIVPNPRADLNEILRLLIERLNLHGPLDDRTARLERLTDHLIEQRQVGRMACLLIDEAQDLETETLDELRLLANLEFEGDALLPMVLVGQLELNLKLDHPSAVRIKQRIALTRSLYPLIRKEVGPYIDCRLKVAGYEKSGLFDPEAINTIAAHSGGIPRMVNAICDNSLFRAYTIKQRVISAHIVDQVARELRINTSVSMQKQISRAFPPGCRDPNESLAHHAEQLPVLFELDDREPRAIQEISDAYALGDPNELDGLTPKMPQKGRSNAGAGIPPSFLPAPWRWYASAAGIALLLLALNAVNSSPPAGIYSLLSGKTQTRASDPAAPPEKNLPSPGNPTASGRSTFDGIETQPAPRESAPSNSGTNANEAVNGANPPSAQSTEPAGPAPESAEPRAQPANPSSVKKNETKPVAVTLEVVARSKVRAQPNDQSEIIAELEPGNRVTVLAKSRDYYHVRSVDDKTIRGYVHREDAFFESTTRR
jgi:general secretion pathway protein A